MKVTLLGPQHPNPNVAEALHGVEGPIVAITAGWRYGEDDLDDFERIVGRPVRSIPLYRWFQEHGAADTAFAATYRRRQQRIRSFKDLYRIRMNAALEAVHLLQKRLDANPELVAPELDRAVDAVRAVDDELLVRLAEIRDQFPAVARPWEVPALRERHEEARALLADAGAVCIAGGNVAVLRNRMRFFGMEVLLRDAVDAGTALVSWSAGAMALCERIVLFYDDPPEGPSEAEVLGRGMGFVKELVLFPHGRRRLRLDDTVRVARMARRVAPATCVTLENGAYIEYGDGRWIDRSLPGSAAAFGIDGSLGPVEAS